MLTMVTAPRASYLLFTAFMIFFPFTLARTLIHEKTHSDDNLSPDGFAYGEEDYEELTCDHSELVSDFWRVPLQWVM